MNPVPRIESRFATALKPRGYRKRARNWFRLLPGGAYQVINLQVSPWGSGSCYVNLGWDPEVVPGRFRPATGCLACLRADDVDVIPSIEWVRPDGFTPLELPGISLLDAEISSTASDDPFATMLDEVVITPIADLMDRTTSVVDLVPLLEAKPWLGWTALRDYLARRGRYRP